MPVALYNTAGHGAAYYHVMLFYCPLPFLAYEIERAKSGSETEKTDERHCCRQSLSHEIRIIEANI